jgi:hypothetical protein
MIRSANFSSCRTWRYALWRRWDEDGCDYAMFIGLNPSTADETNDDPTIRRCIGYAKAWGYSGLCMTNLFAYRATNPQDMFDSAQAGIPVVGADNDQWLRDCAERAGIVVAAWGAHGTFLGRAAEVIAMLPNLHYLRLTKGGAPGHPLYLPKTLTPVRMVA